MESKIFRGLAEAYAEIYASEETEQLDEIIRPTTGQLTAPKAAPRTPQPYRPGGGRQAYNQRRSGTGQMPPPATPRSTSAAKPTPTPVAKPAPTPTVRPAASAPTSRPAASTTPTKPAASSPTKSMPTTGSGYKKDTSITDMIGRSQVRQGAPINTGNKSSDIRSMAARGSVGATPTTSAAKPSPTTRPMGSRKPGSIVSGLDMFDLVKGHLLDEGYADTEESAIAIMANMSEEWRQSIIEGGINFSVPSRTDDFNNRRDELKNRYKQDVGPRIPGPGGGGQNGEPPAPKAMGLRLAKAKGTSNSKNA